MDAQSDCRRTCWILAGVAGLVILILFWWPGSFGFFGALLWAVIIGVVVGFVLPIFLCRENEGEQTSVPPERPMSASEPKSAAGAMAEPKSAAGAMAEPEIASEPEPEPESLATTELEPEVALEPELVSEPELVVGAEPVHYAGEPTPEDVAHEGEQIQPEMLAEPRGGNGDDLMKIKGVGPKLQGMLNTNGIWHFDQIAKWTAEEVAWADANLVTIKGRVSRDDWVGQAKVLALG